MAYSPERMAWYQMRYRCLNPKNSKYKDYGGRGIAVFFGWINDFECFLIDVGPRPASKYSLERIDNDAGYFPWNVKWGTRKEQANNTRRNLKNRWEKSIVDPKTFKSGSSFLTPDDAAQVLQVHIRTIYNRIESGELRAVKLGRVWRIPRGVIEELKSGVVES